jgi:hypothetical protein
MEAKIVEQDDESLGFANDHYKSQTDGAIEVPEGLLATSRVKGNSTIAHGRSIAQDNAIELLSIRKPKEESYDVTSHAYSSKPVKHIKQFEDAAKLRSPTMGMALTATTEEGNNTGQSLASLNGHESINTFAAESPGTNGANLTIDQQYEVLKATYPDRKKYVNVVTHLQVVRKEQTKLQTLIAQRNLQSVENRCRLRDLEEKNYRAELQVKIEASASGISVNNTDKMWQHQNTLLAQKKQLSDIIGDKDTRKTLLTALHVYRTIAAHETQGTLSEKDAQSMGEESNGCIKTMLVIFKVHFLKSKCSIGIDGVSLHLIF